MGLYEEIIENIFKKQKWKEKKKTQNPTLQDKDVFRTTFYLDYSNSDFIIVNADFKDSILNIEFVDNGIQFNPLLKENPNMPNNIDDAHIGGLGIFLTKGISDKIDYHYINGENHLRIIKKVE